MKDRRLLGSVVVLVALAAVPAVLHDTFFLRVATEAIMWVGLAVAFDVLAGYTGYLNFGHSAFFGIGAYATAILMVKAGWPFVPAVAAGGVVAGVGAVIAGLPTLRLRGAYFAIATWALSRGIQQLALIGAVVFALALLAFLLAAMFPSIGLRIAGWLIGRLLPSRMQAGATQLTHKFLGGLAALRSPWSIFMVFLTSVVIWLLETGKYWFVMHAFDFSVSFFALMLMNGIVNLATTIPSAPGYIGTFDAPGIEKGSGSPFPPRKKGVDAGGVVRGKATLRRGGNRGTPSRRRPSG